MNLKSYGKLKHPCADSPLHRPHACTVSRPGPCHCRAGGNCWPSPSCHIVPVWPQPSPPSAPWDPPGAMAPGRSPWETSLLLLKEGREIQTEGVSWNIDIVDIDTMRQWAVVYAKLPQGLRLQKCIKSWCEQRECLQNERLQGEVTLQRKMAHSFRNVYSLARELIKSRILRAQAYLCSKSVLYTILSVSACMFFSLENSNRRFSFHIFYEDLLVIFEYLFYNPKIV